MKRIHSAKIIFVALFTFTISIVNAQQTFNAIVSQDGTLSFRLPIEGLYLEISQRGDIVGYGALLSGQISYDNSGRVERFGNISISYNNAGKMDIVGRTTISYNSNGKIDIIDRKRISYDYNGNIDIFDRERISYNTNGKVEIIGMSTISYNSSGFVDIISDNKGFIIFRPKVAFN